MDIERNDVRNLGTVVDATPNYELLFSITIIVTDFTIQFKQINRLESKSIFCFTKFLLLNKKRISRAILTSHTM
jgi:hypothetical protein